MLAAACYLCSTGASLLKARIGKFYLEWDFLEHVMLKHSVWDL
jgi:hypothetical protein